MLNEVIEVFTLGGTESKVEVTMDMVGSSPVENVVLRLKDVTVDIPADPDLLPFMLVMVMFVGSERVVHSPPTVMLGTLVIPDVEPFPESDADVVGKEVREGPPVPPLNEVVEFVGKSGVEVVESDIVVEADPFCDMLDTIVGSGVPGSSRVMVDQSEGLVVPLEAEGKDEEPWVTLETLVCVNAEDVLNDAVELLDPVVMVSVGVKPPG
ncbi:hypothetical protein QQZ08_009531 [Neonectria magnoliae]|uniref:Uncharacterized protein n=1 Tax=Neonectria magnoliae TaxID=2732573 RepID=A0ABR1HMU3_9HYPO